MSQVKGGVGPQKNRKRNRYVAPDSYSNFDKAEELIRSERTRLSVLKSVGNKGYG